MRKLSSLLDMDEMDFQEFEITSCIQNARKQRFVAQNFIHSSNQYVTPQRIPWQTMASVSSQRIDNITTSSSSFWYLHSDIGSQEYNNHGGH